MTSMRSGGEPPHHDRPDRGLDAGAMVDMDHAATTALCDEAREAMEPFLGGAGRKGTRHGNPSGSHALARDALRALDEARESVAAGLGCEPGEVVFTSGGTEADNQAITGGMPPRSGSPVCSAVEHPAVLMPTEALGGTVVAVDRLGRVDLVALEERLADPGATAVSVVSVMLANNELGTINDLGAVADVVGRHAPDALLHTDAVQAAPWLDLPVRAADAGLVSVSAHKLGGPKGVGALVVRDGTAVRPLLLGGGQERERRGGTHNVAGIVGFAAALRAVVRDRAERAGRVAALRDRLADALTGGIEGVRETVGPDVAACSGAPGDRSHLLPGHCHLLVEGVDSEELMLVLEQLGVCASSASSCASGARAPSHVLAAIGVMPVSGGEDVAALRLTLGVDSTDEDVSRTVSALGETVGRLRDHRGRRGLGDDESVRPGAADASGRSAG
jgi:cysteine desulfurase